MPGTNPDKSSRGRAGAKDGVTELFQMALAYAKQETLDPVLAQLKAVARGVAGAFLLAIGTVLLAVGFVRALQSELGGGPGAAVGTLARTGAGGGYVVFRNSPYGAGGHLSGDWSWVPYMGGALLCVAVAGFCAARIVRSSRR
jgi:hypothetical protein